MTVAGILDEFCSRNPRCHVACGFHASAWVAGAIHDQRRRLDRRENGTGIDLAVHHLIGIDGRWARRRAHVTGDSFDRGRWRVPAHAGTRSDDVINRRPTVFNHCEHLIVLISCLCPGVILARDPTSLRTPDEERLYPLRMSSREETRHRATLGDAENVSALDSGVVHHCADVVGALLEGRHMHGAIGKTGAALIEANEAAELAEALEEKRALRDFPIQIEMRHRPRRPDHVEGPIPRNLICDAHVATARVLCLRQH